MRIEFSTWIIKERENMIVVIPMDIAQRYGLVEGDQLAISAQKIKSASDNQIIDTELKSEFDNYFIPTVGRKLDLCRKLWTKVREPVVKVYVAMKVAQTIRTLCPDWEHCKNAMALLFDLYQGSEEQYDIFQAKEIRCALAEKIITLGIPWSIYDNDHKVPIGPRFAPFTYIMSMNGIKPRLSSSYPRFLSQQEHDNEKERLLRELL